MGMDKKVLVTNSSEATKQLAKTIANKLIGGEVFALYGDLGSGKTTFVQGIARALGVREKVQSPTFVLVKQYKINSKLKNQNAKSKCKIKNLIHADLYRIKSAREVKEIGLVEYFNQPETLVFIEWPEVIEKNLPKNVIKIKFNHLKEDKRIIDILE